MITKIKSKNTFTFISMCKVHDVWLPKQMEMMGAVKET